MAFFVNIGYYVNYNISLRFFCTWVRVDLGYDMTWVRLDRGYELTWVRVDLVRVDLGYELTVYPTTKVVCQVDYIPVLSTALTNSSQFKPT